MFADTVALRRSRKLTHFCSVRVTRLKNSISVGAQHHPRRRRVRLFKAVGAFDIIRAEGAFGSWFVEGKTELTGESGTLNFIAVMPEVLRADLELQNFLDHRRKVGQRPNRSEWLRIVRPD